MINVVAELFVYFQTETSKELPEKKSSAKHLAGHRQRSHTVDNLTAKARLKKRHSRENLIKNSREPLRAQTNQQSSEGKKSGLSWGFIYNRRHRSDSAVVSPKKETNPKSKALPSATLVTTSNYRNLLQVSNSCMNRSADHVNLHSATSTGGNASPDDDYQPASVENLVRKCAECFGEFTFNFCLRKTRFLS